MRRSCFALAFLLGTMASSVLTVGSVQSKCEAVVIYTLPGPASVCGTVAGTSSTKIVLGQSVDAEDEWWEETGGADHVASDDAQQRDADASLATDDSEANANPWWNVAGTGYDDAYDFAMFDGCYLDVIPSQFDAEDVESKETPRFDDEDSGSDAETVSSTGCEDYNYCLGDERMYRESEIEWTEPEQVQPEDAAVVYDDCFMPIDLPASLQSAPSTIESTQESLNECSVWLRDNLSGVIDWTNIVVDRWQASYRAEESTPIVLPEAVAGWGLQKARDAVASIRETTSELYSSAREVDWTAEIRDGWDAFASNETTEPMHEIPATTYTEPEISVDLHDEVLLLTTANTLDQLGLRLQEAAQYLRYWAADRIVAKSNSRRVANRKQ